MRKEGRRKGVSKSSSPGTDSGSHPGTYLPVNAYLLLPLRDGSKLGIQDGSSWMVLDGIPSWGSVITKCVVLVEDVSGSRDSRTSHWRVRTLTDEETEED